ncbi:probable NAD(P)H dehydrogenase (quinone) FQR1-like 1 isoform X1 [Hibiscus syriacus]|uniref:probable NAD(P)H dehydrogenase (quinone) FQR1-like 1 isoform X1 n=1 Tax=Hibiscus syriacus TaxID=106335 RepID=UPI001924957C|nr:probable NAD(P)H dehydrogenase (quinone) FQR1-like 1 isoform X1 [Hibiscus syriacus]
MVAKVYIVYYSLYGHVEKLAQEIKKGADSVEGVEAKIWQVRETLPEEVLGKMHAPPKTDAPIITPDELAEADGVLFGFPTRFGMKPAQFKAFLDSTGGQWRTQALAGKPAGLFYSTSAQGSGQETTALTAITTCSPWYDFCAHWLYIWCWYVRDGASEGWKPLRYRNFGRGWLETAN